MDDASSLTSALQTILEWRYSSQEEPLREMYVSYLERQWSASDLDWELSINPRYPLGDVDEMHRFPFGQLETWRRLPEPTRRRIALKLTRFSLSQLLHGEQGALMVAGQLVNAVPHSDAKLVAAVQTLDEARHVEALSRYMTKVGGTAPIAPATRGVLETVIREPDWTRKVMGMQVVLEGMALISFRTIRRAASEPLLESLLRLVARDEARHAAFGIHYMGRVVPTLSDTERAELEDFTFEIVRIMVDEQTGGFTDSYLAIVEEEGIDPTELVVEVIRRRDEIASFMTEAARKHGYHNDPVRVHVVPVLRKIGLLSERMEATYAALMDQAVTARSANAKAGMRASLPVPELDHWLEAME